nr:glycine-rich protein [Nannocystis pusilla]
MLGCHAPEVVGLDGMVPDAVPGCAGPGGRGFAFTGGPQVFVVPECVTTLSVELWGAQGGPSRCGIDEIHGLPDVQMDGGRGGWLRAELPVRPGEVLLVLVGGRGGIDGAPGWNGGGRGGVWAGGGGGGSDIRIGGASLIDRALVVGGGGGGSCGFPDHGAGGAGGGSSATTGSWARTSGARVAAAGNTPEAQAARRPGSPGCSGSAAERRAITWQAAAAAGTAAAGRSARAVAAVRRTWASTRTRWSSKRERAAATVRCRSTGERGPPGVTRGDGCDRYRVEAGARAPRGRRSTTAIRGEDRRLRATAASRRW